MSVANYPNIGANIAPSIGAYQPDAATPIVPITASTLRAANGIGKPTPNPIGPPTRARTKPRFVKATRRR